MQAFAWGEIVATLQDLKEGLPACIPNYDFVTSSRQAEATAVDSADVILFDGILAFYSAGTPTVPFLLPQRRQGAFACIHCFSRNAAVHWLNPKDGAWMQWLWKVTIAWLFDDVEALMP